jgi:hypothetical protein
MHELEKFEAYPWADGVKRFWSTVTGLITFIVVDLSESILKIILSSFVLIAPLPNAISVFSLAQTELGFNFLAAIAFSAGVEFGPFVMIAISLILFDGLLRRSRRWVLPLGLSVIGTVVIVGVIMYLVYELERKSSSGREVMALLPILSICAFIGLAALAWHKAQPEVVSDGEKSLERERERERQFKLRKRRDELELQALESRFQLKQELEEAKHQRSLGKYATGGPNQGTNQQTNEKPLETNEKPVPNQYQTNEKPVPNHPQTNKPTNQQTSFPLEETRTLTDAEALQAYKLGLSKNETIQRVFGGGKTSKRFQLVTEALERGKELAGPHLGNGKIPHEEEPQ